MWPEHCRDVRPWINHWGHTCADYEREGWCKQGHAVSFSGDVNGFPERSCCACGRVMDATSAGVTQIFFFATHMIPADDARIIRHYATELQAVVTAHMWILLFRSPTPRLSQADSLSRLRSLGSPVCVWSKRDVFTTFPRLPQAIHSSKALNRTRQNEAPYIAQYFWFHASLAVWKAWHGASYPSARFFWRLEPDVLFAGSISTLLRWSGKFSPLRINLFGLTCCY